MDAMLERDAKKEKKTGSKYPDQLTLKFELGKNVNLFFEHAGQKTLVVLSSVQLM